MDLYAKPPLVLFVLTLAGCPKSEPPAARDAGTGGVLDLANPQALVVPGKAALVLHQCSLGCGAKPGIDSGGCSQRCITACASAGDIDSINACASKTADSSPQL